MTVNKVVTQLALFRVAGWIEPVAKKRNHLANRDAREAHVDARGSVSRPSQANAAGVILLGMGVTKATSLADDLVQRFEEQIETGELLPGARFPTEKAITESYGVSRTVVREAYSRLAARGLLVSRRGSGAFVAEGAQFRAFQLGPDEVSAIDDVLKLLEMRIGFEVEMADLAARRRTAADLAEMRRALTAMEESTDVDGSVAADAAFHAAIARATGNSYFSRFTQFLGVRLVPSRRLYLQGDDAKEHQRYARLINHDHEAIYQAIEAGDPAAARRTARRHMLKSVKRHSDLKARRLFREQD